MFSVPLKFSLCQMLTSRPTEYFSVFLTLLGTVENYNRLFYWSELLSVS